ncbi:MAG: hypothetical protein RRA15_04795 [bacterium]|nr:hypothetical protein [bacterium]
MEIEGEYEDELGNSDHDDDPSDPSTYDRSGDGGDGDGYDDFSNHMVDALPEELIEAWEHSKDRNNYSYSSWCFMFHFGFVVNLHIRGNRGVAPSVFANAPRSATT